MAGTRRTPLDRPAAQRISERAVDLFIAMGKLRCACVPGAPSWPCCAGCEKWDDLHSDLHKELRCEPWEWPCVARSSPKHAGSAMMNDEIAARMVMLQEAVKARRAASLPQAENGAAGREPRV
jgi:hypothetical protein